MGRIAQTYHYNDVIRALKQKDSYYHKAGMTGNFDLIHIVVDAEKVIKQAELTDRQTKIFNLYHIQDLTLADVGARMGISHQAVADSLAQSKVKIQKILDSWGG